MVYDGLRIISFLVGVFNPDQNLSQLKLVFPIYGKNPNRQPISPVKNLKLLFWCIPHFQSNRFSAGKPCS